MSLQLKRVGVRKWAGKRGPEQCYSPGLTVCRARAGAPFTSCMDLTLYALHIPATNRQIAHENENSQSENQADRSIAHAKTAQTVWLSGPIGK